jgi:hypothetical protein
MAGGDSLRDDCLLKAEGATRQVCGETKKMKEKKGRNREISSLSLFLFFPLLKLNATESTQKGKRQSKHPFRIPSCRASERGARFWQKSKKPKFLPPLLLREVRTPLSRGGGKNFC